MSNTTDQTDLVNLLVQNLDISETGSNPSSTSPQQGHAAVTAPQRKQHQTNNTPKQRTKTQQGGPLEDQPNNGFPPQPLGAPFMGYAPTVQDLQGRDREWAEYVAIMNLPMGGLQPPSDSRGPQPNLPMNYLPGEEEGIYTPDEASFVQSFVQSPQFLPYMPGYFQHPGFTSQLYSDGRMFQPSPSQMYFQQFMVPPQEGFAPDQLPSNFSYPQPAPATSNGNSVLSRDDPPYEPKNKPKKKNGPRSWVEIANSSSPKNPVQRPKQPQLQPQQILTKSKPVEDPTKLKKVEQPAPEPVKVMSLWNSLTSQNLPAIPNAESINPSNFDWNVPFARFFVIKSYSEDDVHKSIKYGIWASTDNGNRRLDAAFKETNSKGPIYLFFSVNASGQFCGMAQMISPLDYETKCDLWAQDKWNGQFQVKWIFIKDIPNSQFRHIRLSNNENKPVTNSRDTQEVLLEPGREVLRIFSTFKAKTSILDDFSFYDKRQELLKEKKLTENGQEDVPTGSNRSQRYRNNRGPASNNHQKK